MLEFSCGPESVHSHGSLRTIYSPGLRGAYVVLDGDSYRMKEAQENADMAAKKTAIKTKSRRATATNTTKTKAKDKTV